MSDKFIPVREVPWFIKENAQVFEEWERRQWDIQFHNPIKESDPRFFTYDGEFDFGKDTCAVGCNEECPFIDQVPKFQFEHRDEPEWKWNQWGILNKDGYINHIIVLDKGNPYYGISYDYYYFHKTLKDLGITDGFYVMGAMLCRPKDGKSGIEMGIGNCWKNTFDVINNITRTALSMGDSPRVLLSGNAVFRQFFPSYENINLTEACSMQFQHPQFRDVKFNVIPALSNWEYNGSDNINLIMNGLKRFFDPSDDYVIKPSEHYKIIDDLEFFKKVIKKLKESKSISVDIETSGFKFLPMRVMNDDKRLLGYHLDSIIGISFSNTVGTGYYIPLEIKQKVLNEYIQDNIIDDPALLNYFLSRYSEKELNVEDEDEFLFFFGEKEKEFVISSIKDLLEDEKIEKIFQNGKFDTRFLETYYGIKTANYDWDTEYGIHIINENLGKSLEVQSTNFPDLWGYKNAVKKRLKSDDYEEENYADIPLNIVGIYGCGDADLTFRLKDYQLKQMIEEEEYNGKEFLASRTVIEKDKQGVKHRRKVFSKVKANVQNQWLMYNLYLPMVELYREAEIIGILFDEEYALEIANRYSEDLKEHKEWLISVLLANSSLSYEELEKFFDNNKKDGIGSGLINLNSSKQLQKMLYHPDCFGFEPVKPTKSLVDKKVYRKRDKPRWDHAATDKESLKTVREAAELSEDLVRIEITERLLEYKNKEKMISTYLQGKKIMSVLDQNNYLHYNMRLDGTIGGRLSSNPNVQNLPRKTPRIILPDGKIKEATNIRGIFKARDGYKLGACDLAQAELRLMGDYANDLVLINWVNQGWDIHWEATLNVFYHGRKMEYDSKNPEHKKFRKFMKSGNFGRVYGASTPKVYSAMLEKMERGEEKPSYETMELHGEWFFSTFFRIREFLDEMRVHILEHHWIDSKFGRRRRVPAASSSFPYIQEEAVRQAVNSLIQGTSSDITQLAAIRIRKFLKDNNYKTRILWSVHDEIDFEFWEPEIEELKPILPELMTAKVPPIDLIKIKLGSELEIFNNRWGD